MRVLGLDIGKDAIRAVEIETAFRRFEIHDYHEREIESGQTSMDVARSLLENLPRSPDKLGVALPIDQVTFRNMDVPTRDKKAIQSAIRYELEDELPFSISECVYQYSMLSQTKNSTQVHIAAALHSSVEQNLSQWQEASLDPDLVTTEAWAYRTLLNRTLATEEQDQPVLLIRLDEQAAVLYLHWRGTPVFCRKVLWDSDDPETLMKELRRAKLSSRNLTGYNFDKIYLTGNHEKQSEIEGEMAEATDVTVSHLKALSLLSSGGVIYSEQADSVTALAAGIALCFVGRDRNQAIQFRKGEFAKRKRQNHVNLRHFKAPLAAAASVGIVLLLSMGVQSYVYEKKIKRVEQSLKQELRSFFGHLSDSAVRTYLASPQRLKKRVNRKLTKTREMATLVQPAANSPVLLLARLSEAIPSSVTVDLDHIELGIGENKRFQESAKPKAKLAFLIEEKDTAKALKRILKDHMSELEQTELKKVKKEKKASQADEKGEEAKSKQKPLKQQWRVSFQGRFKEMKS